MLLAILGQSSVNFVKSVGHYEMVVGIHSEIGNLLDISFEGAGLVVKLVGEFNILAILGLVVAQVVEVVLEQNFDPWKSEQFI